MPNIFALLTALLIGTLLLISVLVSGCVSLHTVLTNSEGKKVACNADGFGVIGSMITASRHEDCVKRYEAAGFKQ